MEKTIGLDHAYSRHWSESYKTDNSHAKPIQWILHSCSRNPHAKTSRLRRQHITIPANTNSSSDGSEDEIDVESLDEVMSPYVPGRSYDVQKARLHMNETEKFTIQSLMSGKAAHMRSDTDWEEFINKSSWDVLQTKLFSKVVNVLMDEKLARLVFKGVNNEPIARRLSLDRSAACLRRIFAEFAWDQKLTHWLHSLLICHLPAGMLASYLDLIQTLRSKVPSLVERMIMQYTSDSSSASPNTLNILLKRPWEPTLMKYPLLSKERLYDPPIILLIPNSPYASSPTMAHRKRFWNSHLSQLGKVVSVVSPEKAQGMTILSYIEQLATAVRSKISFYKKKYPRRSVILAGWHNASVLSCHISLVEKVDAIICLGFPTQTLNGPRGTVDDVFCDMTAATLFIVGEEADSCDIDKIEDFREQLLTRCENHLLAIPGADDALRVSDRIKRKACVTQHMVDRMILDQIANFLSNTLIMNIGKWHLSENIMDTDTSKSHSKIEGRRKRQNSDEIELAMMKRRKLASVTTAKISEILSGQTSSKGRDGARTPVQGVAYNLQTGSISGLVTVPHALSRALSKTNETVQALKGKGTGRNRNQLRSITIDLAKDTAPQIKRGQSYGISPDPALLATGSQTEAAVAAILGGDFASSEDRGHSPTPRSEDKTVTTSTDSVIATATSSAFRRVSSATNSSLPSSEVPATAATASTYDTVSQYQKPKAAFANVKFQSTVTQKPASQSDTTTALLTINKQHWSGILDSSVTAAVTKTDFPRKYPYLPPSAADNTSHITSRSRKEERETMQATAILEQLTSGIGNDTEQNNQPISGQAGVASYRRHTYDSNFLMEGAGRGRGRGRTRGRTTQQSALTRDGLQRRRKTFQEEERPPPMTSYYQQKQKPKQGSFVRYIMGRDVSAGISDAAAKAPKTMAVATVTSRIEPAKSAQKPSVLPVYTFQQTPSTTSIKIQSLASPVTTIKPGSITAVSKLTTGIPPSLQTTALKKPSKVILGQRLPVKFPGAVPGSSYTFVTIPALTGPPLLAAGQKGTLRKVTPNPTKIKKYSVVPRGNVTVLSSPTGALRPISAISTSAVHVPVSLVALRNKTMTKLPISNAPRPVELFAKPVVKTTSIVPAFTSPSVVLHKLGRETVSDVGEGSSRDAKPKN